MQTQDLKLSIAEKDLGEVHLFQLRGSLEVANVQEAKDLTAGGFDGEAPKILFDLGGIDYIDSAGLGFLIGSLRRASQKGGTVKLCGLSAYMTGVFKIVNLHNIVEVFDDQDAALEAFRGAGRTA